MIDHSLTYKRKTFRNIPHILRLRKILRTLKSLAPKRDESYLDIGCSNGYITDVVRSTYCLGVCRGMDHVVENLELARQRYPDSKFEFIDLNKQVLPERVKFEIITCFETLEHVGDLTNAIKNIIAFGDPGSRILISVPIEIGMVGIVKFLLKVLLYRYSLNELPGKPGRRKYFYQLVQGKRISTFRDKREGWGTHFGFDYRDVDDILIRLHVQYSAFNSFSTRFYIIKK